MKKSLNVQILLGALIGTAIGLIILFLLPTNSAISSWILYLANIIGKLFINSLKMILIPLVFSSIVVGIANLKAHAQMTQVWTTALFYFLTTTACAILLGLIVVNIFKPGIGLDQNLFAQQMSQSNIMSLSLADHIENFLSNLFMNPIAAMADGNVLPTVVFAIIIGIALIAMGDKTQRIHDLMNESFELIMKIVQWIMLVAPYGIGALLAKLVATQDLALLSKMGYFIMIVLGAFLFHGLIVLPSILWITTRFSPKRFFIGMREALITAFSTSSSSATLPITMKCVENNLKVNKDVAGFVLPLGATINMDGTALYEAVAALFIANLVGIELSLVQQCIVFFMAMVAAIGAPGIPSAGMVTMAMVLQSVNLPIEAIAILLPIDRLLDAVRTTINVEGDAIGSIVVQHVTNKK